MLFEKLEELEALRSLLRVQFDDGRGKHRQFGLLRHHFGLLESVMHLAKQRRSARDLEELPGGNSAAVGIAEQLRREIIAVGAVDKTRTLIREFLDDARMAAEEPILPADLREGLLGLLNTLGRKYFA